MLLGQRECVRIVCHGQIVPDGVRHAFPEPLEMCLRDVSALGDFHLFPEYEIIQVEAEAVGYVVEYVFLIRGLPLLFLVHELEIAYRVLNELRREVVTRSTLQIAEQVYRETVGDILNELPADA